MHFCVFVACYDLQVLYAIVEFVLIQVMDNLIARQWTPYVQFHHQTMLESHTCLATPGVCHMTFRNGNNSIAIFVDFWTMGTAFPSNPRHKYSPVACTSVIESAIRCNGE